MSSIDVAVNLLWLAPGRVGGSEEYLTRQLLGLADPELAVTIFAADDLAAAHPELADRFRIVRAPYRRDSRPVRIAAEHTWLAHRTRHADVVHHGGGTSPAIGRRASVVTVHDIQYTVFPEYFSRARLAYLRATMPGSMRRAGVVTTPSEYVRCRVLDVFDAVLDPDRVVVVPHGVPTLTLPPTDVRADALRRHGVDRPYVIYPAITHPHKGHGVLLELARASAAPGHPLHDVQIVLTGGAGAREAAIAAQLAGDPALAGRVIRTGRVTSADRDALVAGAEALVFPSEYEGFGAPLVEAMMLGVPVVAGAHPALVEVLGGAGVIVAAPDPEAWTAGVVRALAERDQLVDRGAQRRAAFTPERSGAALADAYRLAVSIQEDER